MLFLFLILLLLAMGLGLLPFLLPGSIYGMFGLVINRWLGDFLGSTLGLGAGTLVAAGPTGFELTQAGVLVVLGIPLLLVTLALRGR